MATTRTIIRISSADQAIPAGEDTFILPATSAAPRSTTEALMQSRERVASTVRNLSAHVYLNNVTASSTVKSRINGADGNLLLSIPASTSGTFMDTTHSDSLSAGDLFAFRHTIGATGTTLYVKYSASFHQASDFSQRTGYASTIAQGVTSYTAFDLLTSATETIAQTNMNGAGTWKRLRAYVYSNTITASTSITSRKNSSAGNQTLTIPASTTGEFEDTTNSDSFSNGDDLCYRVVGGSGGTSMGYIVTSDLEFTDGSSFMNITSATARAFGTTVYFGIAGSTTNAGTEDYAKSIMPVAGIASKMQVKSFSNSLNAAAVVKFRNNGADGNQSISISATSTGWFEDTTNSDSVAAGSMINYSIAPGGSAGSITFTHFTVQLYGGLQAESLYSEAVTFTDTFLKRAGKVLNEVSTFTDTISRIASRTLSEAITYVDSLTKIKILSKVVSDSVTYVDTLLRLVGKVFAENETYVDTPTTSGGGSSVFKIKTGTYTGNGSDNRAITGIGFQPTLVWIKPKDTTANNGAMSWDALGSDKSFDPAGSSTPSANMIQSFDVDGFTIGTEANVNTSGVDYVWVAMTGTASYVKTGSYVGNGTSSNVVSGVGFQPDFIIIKRNGSSQGGYYWSLGNYRYTWTSNNGVSGVIIDNSDGFEVLSTSSVVNSNGVTYHYFCLKLDAAWGKMDSYTGNATDNNAKTGVGFSPDFVWIKSTSASKPAAFRTRDGHSGDSTTTWIASTADAADLIQSLDADGFTLGTSGVVNASTSYRYLALRSAPSSASYNTTLTETVTLADTFIRNAMRVLSESVTYIDVVLKTASRTLSEVVTYIDSVQTNLTSLKTKVLSEVVTFTDTIIRTLTRVLSESVTYIATFNTAYNVVISNSVTYVDTVLKRAGKTIIEAFSPIDTLIRSLTRILSESVTYTDIFASIKMRVITITNSFTLSDTLTKLVLKVILAVENVQFIDILKVYLNGVLGRWVKKFSSRGTSYNDKNAKRNTVYSDKYSKNNTDRWNNKYF